MSRVGKKTIPIPSGVTLIVDSAGCLSIKGPKGELKWKPNPLITVTVKENEVRVSREGDEQGKRELHGLTRTLIENMIIGVTKGYNKTLEITGVGYRMNVQGNKLLLTIGYSQPILYPAPPGITFKVDEEKKNLLAISGIDKQLVGQVAAELRAFRKPEPYKGKGIKYLNEHIRRKAGKTAAKVVGTTLGA